MRNTSILNSKINFYIGTLFIAMFGFFALTMTLHAARLANPLLDTLAPNADTYTQVLGTSIAN